MSVFEGVLAPAITAARARVAEIAQLDAQRFAIYDAVIDDLVGALHAAMGRAALESGLLTNEDVENRPPEMDEFCRILASQLLDREIAEAVEDIRSADAPEATVLVQPFDGEPADDEHERLVNDTIKHATGTELNALNELLRKCARPAIAIYWSTSTEIHVPVTILDDDKTPADEHLS